MPIYEYACVACGRHIDVVHGIHAAGPTTCEACGGAMKKELTAPAIHFKGSGWAKKDARAAAAPATPAATEKKDDVPASGEPAAAGTPAATGDTAAPAPAPTPVPAAPAPAATSAPSTTGG